MRIGDRVRQSGTQTEAAYTQTESKDAIYGDRAIQES